MDKFFSGKRYVFSAEMDNGCFQNFCYITKDSIYLNTEDQIIEIEHGHNYISIEYGKMQKEEGVSVEGDPYIKFTNGGLSVRFTKTLMSDVQDE